MSSSPPLFSVSPADSWADVRPRFLFFDFLRPPLFVCSSSSEISRISSSDSWLLPRRRPSLFKVGLGVWSVAPASVDVCRCRFLSPGVSLPSSPDKWSDNFYERQISERNHAVHFKYNNDVNQNSENQIWHSLRLEIQSATTFSKIDRAEWNIDENLHSSNTGNIINQNHKHRIYQVKLKHIESSYM